MCCVHLTFTFTLFQVLNGNIIGPIEAMINSLEQIVRQSLDEEKVHITEKEMDDTILHPA